MELRFHQHGNRTEWDAGCDVWDDLLGWGAVRVNGDWLLDANGNRRRFKNEAGAVKAAKQYARKFCGERV